METKKYVIYDCQSYFSRFLKYEFRKTLHFDIFKSFNALENGIHPHSVVLYVIYSEEELVNFMKIYKQGIPLIVCTFNTNLLLIMRNMEGILLLDTSKVKAEFRLELKSYLNQFHLG